MLMEIRIPGEWFHELGTQQRPWRLTFSVSRQARLRHRTVEGGRCERLLQEITYAKGLLILLVPAFTTRTVGGAVAPQSLDRGFMTCHDARTGKEVYGKTRFPEGAKLHSSPWAYNGKIFCLSEDGDTHVNEAGSAF